MRVMIGVNPRGLDEGQAGVARQVVTEHIHRMLATLKKALDEPVGLTWVWGDSAPSQEELQAAKWRLKRLQDLQVNARSYERAGEQELASAFWTEYHTLREQQMAFEQRYREYFDREVNDGEEKED